MQGMFGGTGSVTLLIIFYSSYCFSAFLVLFQDLGYFFFEHLHPGLIFFFSATLFKLQRCLFKDK